MNIRELETILRKTREYIYPIEDYTACPTQQELTAAISYCVRQQKATAKRKFEFKLKAAEQRELLR